METRESEKKRKKERHRQTNRKREYTKLRDRRQNERMNIEKAAAALERPILLRGSLQNLHL